MNDMTADLKRLGPLHLEPQKLEAVGHGAASPAEARVGGRA